jgi:hypothetical protein
MTDEPIDKVTLGEVYRAVMELKADIGGVNLRLDTLNGRTRVAETKIAIIEDRGSRDTAARWGAFGSALGAIASGLMAWNK